MQNAFKPHAKLNLNAFKFSGMPPIRKMLPMQLHLTFREERRNDYDELYSPLFLPNFSPPHIASR